MKNRFFLTAIATTLVLGLATFGFSAQDVRIAASIGNVHEMNVALYKIVGASPWQSITDLVGEGMDFGALVRGEDNVYRTTTYFVIEAPVVSNHTSWTITHTRTNFANTTPGLTDKTLNLNTNVKFLKFNNADELEYSIGTLPNSGYMSYDDSNDVQVDSSTLAGGRLRIYYSIAKGSDDADGVLVITPESRPSGSYVGKITLTLSA